MGDIHFKGAARSSFRVRVGVNRLSLFKLNLINMNIHIAPCSCSVELYKLWYTLADFSQTGIFAGFSLHIINLAVRISAAAMAGGIIFFSLAGPVGDYTGAHTVIFQGFFSVVQWQDKRMYVYFKPKPKDSFTFC